MLRSGTCQEEFATAETSTSQHCHGRHTHIKSEEAKSLQREAKGGFMLVATGMLVGLPEVLVIPVQTQEESSFVSY
jgi:hypothetical protein